MSRLAIQGYQTRHRQEHCNRQRMTSPRGHSQTGGKCPIELTSQSAATWNIGSPFPHKMSHARRYGTADQWAPRPTSSGPTLRPCKNSRPVPPTTIYCTQSHDKLQYVGLCHFGTRTGTATACGRRAGRFRTPWAVCDFIRCCSAIGVQTRIQGACLPRLLRRPSQDSRGLVKWLSRSFPDALPLLGCYLGSL